MAIVASDLIAPTGALSSSLLSAVAEARTPAAADGDEVATGLAAAGNAKVADWSSTTLADRAALAWAYYQGLSERAQQILAGAMSATAADEGGESFSTAQAVELQRQADTWLAKFEALEAEEELVDADAVVLPVGSRTVTNRFVW